MDADDEFYLGLGLAISSCFFIGASFIIKKIGLIRLSNSGVRASNGGYGYLKDYIWWAGLIFLGLGESLNFTAYAYAPAALVTPLGALSIIIAAMLASKFLKEKLNLLGKIGCVLCILGSTIIVIHSPKETEVENLAVLMEKLQGAAFITYVIFIIILSIFLAVYMVPRYGHKNVIINILLCSTIGSLTVMSSKALGLALKDTISGRSNDFGTFFPYILILITVFFIVIQINYLNRSLDIFSTNLVTPIYYVLYTTFVIIASSILYEEFGKMTTENVLGDICGFLVVIIGVFLLNGFRELDLTFEDINRQLKPHRELLKSNSHLHFENNIIERNYGTNSKDFC